MKWFKTVEDLPYGYHNFLFGWIDTPEKNLPSVLDAEILLTLFAYIERLYAFPMDRIMSQAMNKRLGTEGRNLAEIANLVAERGMKFSDLMAEVERDGWEYNDGLSYVCSAFAAGLYKAGGLLPLPVEAT